MMMDLQLMFFRGQMASPQMMVAIEVMIEMWGLAICPSQCRCQCQLKCQRLTRKCGF